MICCTNISGKRGLIVKVLCYRTNMICCINVSGKRGFVVKVLCIRAQGFVVQGLRDLLYKYCASNYQYK